MGDEFKSIRESLLRSVLSGLTNGNGASDRDPADDSKNARDLIVTLLSRAGKGKDEIVQILAREIGVAIAAMLRGPLSELAKHQKLQITFEFVPKSGSSGSTSSNPTHKKSSKGSVRPRKKKTTKKKKTTRTARN